VTKVWSPTGKARGTSIFGGTRQSTSTYAKATADTLFTFIHGQSPWLSAKAGKVPKIVKNQYTALSLEFTCYPQMWSPTGKARGTSIFGGTRRSTSTYAKATADTLFTFIHGQSPWLSAKAGKDAK